jgi:hypothetical protein
VYDFTMMLWGQGGSSDAEVPSLQKIQGDVHATADITEGFALSTTFNY